MNNQTNSIAPGSTLYYSLLYTPAQQRQAIAYLFKFFQTVHAIRFTCTDSQVAQQKLNWWQQELTQMYQGSANHPLAKALQPIVTQFKLPKIVLTEIIADALAQLDTVYATFDEYVQLLQQAPHVIKIISHYILGTDDSAIEFTNTLSVILRLAEHIIRLRQALLKGILNFPLADLERHGIKPDDLLNQQYTDSLAELIKEYNNYCQQNFHAALATLPIKLYRQQLPLLIYSHINLALLNEIAHAQTDIFKYQLRLTPLRKLWIAWKTKLSTWKYYLH